ncbi:MAG: methylmalonyl Co-A mutase-associated GTPase MeaB [Bdellovibrionaceae bacterium]|nr:methylmalonyl Co-A mutase-associated GTPase MeaB [Pseudobdellovibrionaceae bacterium]
MTPLLDEFNKKSLRALSKSISAAENRDPQVLEMLAQLYGKTGNARVFGITGPPGAGKSTLISHFVKYIRQKKQSVAVIAVDPMSPFTGGALLGDRIRLIDHFIDDKVFIRSLSTRGKLGGLSVASRQVIDLVDAFGFDYVIVETVGVGQSEVDIRNLADTTLVVLVPEAGDAIQTIKAGLLEIADLFLIHKSDREGAEKLQNSLSDVVRFADKQTPVLLSSIQREQSIEAVFKNLNSFYEKHQPMIQERKNAAAKSAIVELIESELARAAHVWVETKVQNPGNPYTFVQDFWKTHRIDKFFSQ